MKWFKALTGFSGLVLFALSAVAVPARPQAALWDPVQELSPQGWQGSGQQHFQVSGAHITLQQFSVNASPADAARQLMAISAGRLTRMQLADGVVFLSGLRLDAHWLAEVRQQGDRTIGLISRLQPSDTPAAGFDPAQLLPSGAERLLFQQEALGHASGVLSQFRVPGTVDKVRGQLFDSLRLAGWAPEDTFRLQASRAREPVAIGAQIVWRHPQMGHLTFFMQSTAPGVLITFWHRATEPS